MTYDPKVFKATDAEKEEAFEWLRAFALSHDKDWRKAAIMLEENVRLGIAARSARPEELKIVAWTDGTGFNFLSAATKAHWDAEGWHQEISERYTIPVYQREPQGDRS